MVGSGVTTGELRLSDRGFREDIELAMGNDVRRAIIELVTNSDDSYVRKGEEKGEIVVDVEHRHSKPKVIRVNDDAEGMIRADIESRLAVTGEETSGFDSGSRVRGFFGRGGRDVVHFGPVTWRTWKDGEHHEFSLEHRTVATRRYSIRTLAPRPDRQSGTLVTLEVQKQFRIPRHSTLMDDLSRHYALRPILTDGSRSRIFLRDSGKPQTDELKYQQPTGELLGDVDVTLTGYPGAAHVTIFQSPEPLSDGKDRSYWRHSLLITSQGVAYDIFPGGRFANEPFASSLACLHGTIDVPQLAELMRDFDSRESKGIAPDESNPTRLVRRDRTGLSRDHPFVQVLYKAIEDVLDPHISRLQEEAKSERAGRVSDESRRRFGDASRILGEYLEEEEVPVEGGGGGGGPSDRTGLSIIPSSQVLEPGESGALTLRYQEAGGSDSSIDAPTVYVTITLRHGESYKFSETLRKRKGYFSKGIHVKAEIEGEIAQVHARYKSHPAEGTVRWQHRERPSIEALQWQRKSYTLAKDKNRYAALYAPWPMVADDDDWRLKLSPDNSVEIVIKGSFEYDYELDAGVAVVELRVADDGEPQSMIAEVSDERAMAELRLSKPPPGGLHIDLDSFNIQRRAWYEDESGVLRVNANHPAVRRLLGDKEEGWPGQDSLAFQSMLAEVLAATIVRHSMSRTIEVTRESDVNDLFAAYDTKVSILVANLQRVLVDASRLKAATSNRG